MDESEIRWHTSKREPIYSEVMINGWKRDWEAADKTGRYLGIHRGNVFDKVNGIVFNLRDEEHDIFMRHEDGGKLYDLKSLLIYEGRPVYGLVTKNPTHDGVIPKDYIRDVKTALSKRSWGFQVDFWNTTPAPEMEMAHV